MNRINNFISNIRSSNYNNDFLNANTIVSNFAFLILAVFVFVIISAIGMNLISYYLSPSDSPKLLNGMVSGNQYYSIKQNPNLGGALPVKRSNNAHEGIEFTWSFWLFLDGGPGSDSTVVVDPPYKHVFHKGDRIMNVDSLEDNEGNTLTNAGMSKIQNAPGLYIKPFTAGDNTTASLTFVMNTFDTDSIIESVDIDNVPINKWFNVMIILKNRFLDVYVNGTVKNRKLLMGLPKQNYGDIHIGNVSGDDSGGFNGYLSNLWYYNYALGTREIEGIISSGASTKLVGGDSINTNTKDFYFLSLRWFMPEPDSSTP